MSHPTSNLSPGTEKPIGHKIVELQTVDSTNNYAMAKVHEGMALPGTIYFANEQTKGKGQRGKSWSTRSGENIIMSIVLSPRFLRPVEQFFLNSTIAIACHDFLNLQAPGLWSIKWPNDLYWRDRKAGGILIESISQGHQWLWAVVGIGININQIEFEESIPNPISLKQITGRTSEIISLVKELATCIQIRYDELKSEKNRDLFETYNQLLYRKDQPIKLKKDKSIVNTTLKAVSPQGQLITYDSEERRFDLGEVEWILELDQK